MEKEVPDKGGELVILCAPVQHFHTLKRKSVPTMTRVVNKLVRFLLLLTLPLFIKPHHHS
jgi:hypothetical protein